jgi:hypothetical protein
VSTVQLGCFTSRGADDGDGAVYEGNDRVGGISELVNDTTTPVTTYHYNPSVERTPAVWDMANLNFANNGPLTSHSYYAYFFILLIIPHLSS